jgi:hypothetical protein
MRKLTLILLILSSGEVFSMDVPGTIIEIAPNELENIGVSGVAYQNKSFCYGLHDIEIRVP